VLCEKPMTMTVEEGEDIVRTARETGKICAVNYGYTGYSLVRHMKAMVARGDLGKDPLVKAEFAMATTRRSRCRQPAGALAV
jgi:predicted dehydrogenase